jgi:hypothetical protein
MYYRFGSNLDGAVLLAYEKIGNSMEKFLVDAILLNFNEEGRRAIETQILEEKVKNKDKNTREELTQQLKNYTNEQINSLKKIFTNKPEPPVVASVNNPQPPAQQTQQQQQIQIIQPGSNAGARIFVPPTYTEPPKGRWGAYSEPNQYEQPKQTVVTTNPSVFVPPPYDYSTQQRQQLQSQTQFPKRSAVSSSNSFLSELDNISGGEVSSEYKSRKTGLVFNNINNNKKD